MYEHERELRTYKLRSSTAHTLLTYHTIKTFAVYKFNVFHEVALEIKTKLTVCLIPQPSSKYRMYEMRTQTQPPPYKKC